MTAFRPGGPVRFRHQVRGLRTMIRTGGRTALLFDPGMGKTAVVLDYASLLALKSETLEARVLVICPPVAVDTWVLQAEKFISPQAGYWAEALDGTLLERAEALAARGGDPFPQRISKKRPTPPRGWIKLTDEADGSHSGRCEGCLQVKRAKRASTIDQWWPDHLAHKHPEYRPNKVRIARALHYEKSILIGYRQPDLELGRPMNSSMGPDGVWGPRVVLEVINLDTVSRRTKFGSRTMADVMLGAVKRFAPDLVVIDESHKIKGPSSHASLLMARIAKLVSRRVILTGTVAPYGILDIFAQWRFLDPYAFGEKNAAGVPQETTFEQFKNRYVQYGGWDDREIKGYVNLDHLQSVMAQNAVVARKQEALDLPPTTDVVLRVDLSPMEKNAYEEMRKHLSVTLAPGVTASVGNRLTQMLRLRQITSGCLPEDGGPLRTIGTSKVDMIRSLVQDTLVGEKRIVIFALFSHEIAVLADTLAKDKDTEVMVIQGSTPADDRLKMRQAFGDVAANPRRIVLIAQIKTMSLAVNELVSANHAIFASLSQQRDDLTQAKARLDRTGQTRPVTFWFALAPRTVDEVILASHRERTDLEDALLQHVAGGPAIDDTRRTG